jgi:hypothetical protein
LFGGFATQDKYSKKVEAVPSSSIKGSPQAQRRVLGGCSKQQHQRQHLAGAADSRKVCPVAAAPYTLWLLLHFFSLFQGLVKYDYSSSVITLLASHVSDSSPIDPGSEITYANDLAIASDGKIYFTSCSDIAPAPNKEGFYDTFKAWTLGMAQVRV